MQNGNGKVALNERELVIASTLVVQALGRATPEEVLETLESNGMTADREALVYSLERMRDRQILSESGKISKGHREKAYKMRRVIWGSVPEIAQIKPMLPKLVESKEASELLETLKSTENEGGKKGRKPEITEYHLIRLDLEAILPICGGVPFGTDSNGFARVEGHIFLKPLGFQNSLKSLFRQAGLTESKRMYVYPRGIFVKPKKDLVQIQRPIHDERTGRGLGVKTFEALAAGERFPVWVAYPFEGLLPLEDFVRIWRTNPVHLGAFYSDYGATTIVEYEDLGQMTQAATSEKLTVQMKKYFG